MTSRDPTNLLSHKKRSEKMFKQNRGKIRTLHDDMLSIPELFGAEFRRSNSGDVLPCFPVRPILLIIDRVAELVCAQGLVCESVRVSRFGERRGIVVCVGEYDDVVRLSLAEEEMINLEKWMISHQVYDKKVTIRDILQC